MKKMSSWYAFMRFQESWYSYMGFLDGAVHLGLYIRLTPQKKFWISTSLFGTGFRMGKTRPCEFFQIYRPISFIWQPNLSAQGDLHGEIPENRFLVITFDWSVLRTSGRPV